MTRPKKPKYTAEQFIAAIPNSGGIISTIAKRVGCDWYTVKAYMERYPTVQQAYDNECEFTNDMALSVVVTAIKEGDLGTAKWWITKKRPEEFGDIAKLEHSGEVGTVIKVTITDD
jgi:hypothetical protein